MLPLWQTKKQTNKNTNKQTNIKCCGTEINNDTRTLTERSWQTCKQSLWNALFK